MKLDKIKFAKVVSWISRITNGLEFAEEDLRELDDIIDINVEPVIIPSEYINHHAVDTMLEAIANDRKILAIIAYRSMTGEGLKDSKDAIERYWLRQPAQTG